MYTTYISRRAQQISVIISVLENKSYKRNDNFFNIIAKKSNHTRTQIRRCTHILTNTK